MLWVALPGLQSRGPGVGPRAQEQPCRPSWSWAPRRARATDSGSKPASWGHGWLRGPWRPWFPAHVRAARTAGARALSIAYCAAPNTGFPKYRKGVQVLGDQKRDGRRPQPISLAAQINAHSAILTHCPAHAAAESPVLTQLSCSELVTQRLPPKGTGPTPAAAAGASGWCAVPLPAAAVKVTAMDGRAL